MYKMLMAGLMLSCGIAGDAQVPASRRPTRASADQLAAEARVLGIVRDSRVVAAVDATRQRLLSDPATRSAGGLASLDRALSLWLHSLALYEAGGDTSRPTVLWSIDSSPHEWFGHRVPGSGAAGDNPDNIYLNSFINGASRYELQGRITPDGPVDFTIEVIRAEPGRFLLPDLKIGQKAGNLANQIRVLRMGDLHPDAEGRFTVTLGPDTSGAGPVHVLTPALPLEITYRNTLSDWTHAPVEVTIRRTDAAPAGPALTDDQLARNVARDFPDWAIAWAAAKERWFGAENSLAPVRPRDGGWGMASGGRFDLAQNQALVITTSPGGARYTGVVIFDRWYLGSDVRRAVTSLNNEQAVSNEDGTTTYVISPRDPGVANWLDAGSAPQGFVGLRWQNVPPDTDPASLIKSVRLIDLADLPSALPGGFPRISAEQRVLQLRQRVAAYESRLTSVPRR